MRRFNHGLRTGVANTVNADFEKKKQGKLREPRDGSQKDGAKRFHTKRAQRRNCQPRMNTDFEQEGTEKTERTAKFGGSCKKPVGNSLSADIKQVNAEA